jgi:hypothetical protein
MKEFQDQLTKATSISPVISNIQQEEKKQSEIGVDKNI